MAGRNLTPAEGFTAGVLSGAGFALFENLGNASIGGEGWSTLVTVRISTVLLHVLTTGLTGWALASAWREKRYLRLGLAFTVSIALHGMWNGMAVLSVAASQLPESLGIPPAFRVVGFVAMAGLVMLLLVNFGIYLGLNGMLRRSLPASPTPALIAVPAQPQPVFSPQPDDLPASSEPLVEPAADPAPEN